MATSTTQTFVPTVLGLLAGSLILLLTDSWVRLPLYILCVLLVTGVFHVLVSRPSSREHVARMAQPTRVFPSGLGELISMGLGGFLWIAESLQWESPARVVLAFIFVVFVPGYAVTSLTGLARRISRLEQLVLVVLFSILFVGGQNLILSYLAGGNQGQILLLVNLLLVGWAYHRRESEPVRGILRPRSLNRRNDLLAIALCFGLFLAFFINIYPEVTLEPSFDISRHYWNATSFNRNPELYWDYGLINYFLYHAFEAGRMTVSGPASIQLFQCLPFFLNLLLPLAFYAVVKRYAPREKPRLPVLAMLFWVFFNNLSFLHVIASRIENPGLSSFDHVVYAAILSADGAIYSPQPFGWFTPLSLAYLFLLLLLVTLKLPASESRGVTILTGVLVFGIYTTHVSEAIVFSILLVVLAWLPITVQTRTRPGIHGCIVGLGAGYALKSLVLSRRGFFSPFSTEMLVLYLLVASMAWYMTGRTRINRKVHDFIRRRRKIKGRGLRLLITGLFLYFLTSLLVWLADIERSMVSPDQYKAIYWFQYPVLLGIAGILAVGALHYHQKEEYKDFTTLFPVFALTVALLGKGVTVINTHFFFTYYWENRLFSFVFLFICCVAPIPLVEYFSKRQVQVSASPRRRRHVREALLVYIIITGFASTVSQFESWDRAKETHLREGDLEAVVALREFLDNDPRAAVLSFSPGMVQPVAFAGPSFRNPYSKYLLTARSPEMSLQVRNWDSRLSHSYLFLQASDLVEVRNYPDSHLVQNTMPYTPIVFQNGEATIFNASGGAPPRADAPSELIVPFPETNESSDVHMVYEFLSAAAVNYTPSLDVDPTILGKNLTILGFDPPEAGKWNGKSIEEYEKYVRAGHQLVVLNTGGAGHFTNIYLEEVGERLTNCTTLSGRTPAHLSTSISVNKSRIRSNAGTNIAVVSNYTNSHECSPYLVRVALGEGLLYLVNIRPLVAWIKQDATNGLYPDYPRLLDPVPGLPRVSAYSAPTLDASFSFLGANGQVNVTSSSVIVLPNQTFHEATFSTGNGSSPPTSIPNCQDLVISGSASLRLNSSRLAMAQGRGFYANLNLGKNLTVTFPGNSGALEVRTDHGDLSNYTGLSRVSLSATENIGLLARNAQVSILGALYLYNLYHGTTFDGEDVNANGYLTLAVHLTDINHLARSFQLDASYVTSPPLSRHDWRETLPLGLKWLFIIAVLAVAVWSVYPTLATTRSQPEPQQRESRA